MHSIAKIDAQRRTDVSPDQMINKLSKTLAQRR
jgi:hypothetical protein